MRIVITGATGWVGRSMIAALIENFGTNIVHSIEAYSTTNSVIEIDKKIKIPSIPIQQMNTKRHIDLFVPLAFKNQDQFNVLGPIRYLSENIELIERHKKIILNTEPTSVISFSSGITHFSESNLSRQKSYYEYKKLKELEFNSLAEESSKSNSNFLSCTLYSISGKYMSNPKKYALGDFINQAIVNGKIEVKARNLIFRKYVDSIALAKLALKLVAHQKFTQFCSGGHLVELHDLAHEVGRIFDLPSELIRSEVEFDLPPDNYYCAGQAMEILMHENDIQNSTMYDQILSTSSGPGFRVSNPLGGQ
jgi:nucleoside-diphosphate-sugar epimerase